jgi:uncharacterized RDD family membrane protein YckC
MVVGSVAERLNLPRQRDFMNGSPGSPSGRDTCRAASAGRRAAGATVDVAVLTPVLALLDVAAGRAYQHSGVPNETLLLYPLAAVVLVLAYQFVFLAAVGATPGMLLTRLRLVSADGKAAATNQIVVRLLVSCLSLAVFGLGYIWAFFHPAGQTWHDIAAGTIVSRSSHRTRMRVSRRRWRRPEPQRYDLG